MKPVPSQGPVRVPQVETTRNPIRLYIITNTITGAVNVGPFQIDDRTRHLLIVNDGAVVAGLSNLLFNFAGGPLPTGQDGVVHPGDTFLFDEILLERGSQIFLAGDNAAGDLRFFIYGW